ncbi:MAG: hypothetical protein Q9162_005239 [Coniocarpon cinnabarinum]
MDGISIEAKLDQLKAILGAEFPEIQPVATLEGSSRSTNAHETTKDALPLSKIANEISEDDSDSETMHRPPQRKRAPKKNTKIHHAPPPSTAAPFRAKPHLLHFNPNHDRLGELAPVHQAFCPIMAVSKYPYKFVASDISESIADRFFNAGKFWDRTWDIYYVWPQISISAKPFLLIPVEQVDQLLDEIFFAFDQQERYFLILGDEAKDFGLLLEFPEHPSLRPRYLGCTQSRETFQAMERNVPLESFRPPHESPIATSPDTVSKSHHERLMSLIMEISKGNNKTHKAASKKQQQGLKKRDWKNELRRAERLLGMRPTSLSLPEPDQDASWEALQAYHAAKSAHRKLHPINPNQPVPFDFEKLPVFISIDVECYELDKSKVTEIGLAMFDTATAAGIAPGRNGVNWQSLIKARHFRIKEHAHLRNELYVHDAAEKFEFPKNGSELISSEEASNAVKSCFSPPFCDIHRPWLDGYSSPGDEVKHDLDDPNHTADYAQGSDIMHERKVPKSLNPVENSLLHPTELQHGVASPQQRHPVSVISKGEPKAQTANTPLAPGRNVVLVGHDIDQDIRYLRRTGVDLASFETAATLDTCNLYRAHEHEWNATSLSAILSQYDMTAWNAHNAGNDAVYTLWGMLALVLAHTMERGDPAAKQRFEERQKQREMDDVVRAGVHARDMAEGWESEAE